MDVTRVFQIGSVVVFAALLSAVGVQTYRLAGAQGERDIVRVELAGTKLELEAERVSTKTAVDGALRCNLEHAEQGARFTAALAAANTATEKARRAARGCTSDEAVAARLGAVTK